MKRRDFFKLICVSPLVAIVKPDKENKYIGELTIERSKNNLTTIRDIIDPEVVADLTTINLNALKYFRHRGCKCEWIVKKNRRA